MRAPKIRFNAARFSAVAFLLAGLLAVSACGLNAVSRGKVAPAYGGPAAALSGEDRAKIRSYFAKQPPAPSTDSARGLARGDRVGGAKLVPLPSALESRLAPLAGGYRRARVGYDVLIVDAQNTIVDIAYDAAR